MYDEDPYFFHKSDSDDFEPGDFIGHGVRVRVVYSADDVEAGSAPPPFKFSLSEVIGGKNGMD